jgi:hypothetical protein
MKEQSRQKSSRLNDQIEIIREDRRPREEPTPTPLIDENNPLHALKQLVEKLEALEELPLQSGSTSDTDSSAGEGNARARSYLSEVDHYLNLFQKQSAVLRKLSSKLN